MPIKISVSRQAPIAALSEGVALGQPGSVTSIDVKGRGAFTTQVGGLLTIVIPETATVEQRVAGTILSGHRVVKMTPAGFVEYADAASGPDALAVYGVTLQAVASGATVDVTTHGPVDEPSWSWVPDQPVFLGANGMMTQTPPTFGGGQAFSIIVGIALSATRMSVGIQNPIILA